MAKFILPLFLLFTVTVTAQNVGLGTLSPTSKLHIEGSQDVPQLTIDAFTTQSGINPLIRLRSAGNTELLRIHSDHTTNTFVGREAGKVNVVDNQEFGGMDNTFIGNWAGQLNTSGSGNTSVGSRALEDNSSGQNNTAIGYIAMGSNISGHGNIGFGNSSLSGNSTGNNNLAIGSLALGTSVAGDFGFAIGFFSQRYANNSTVGFNNTNTSVGHYALRGSTTPANNTGNNNTAIGWNTLMSNAGGKYNTATGFEAMISNTYGDYNVAYGTDALSANTSGHTNVAVGYSALLSNMTGNNSVAIGHSALRHNTTASYNIACGVDALNGNVAGSKGVAIGAFSQAYANNTTSQWDNTNTSVGYYSLHGSYNSMNNTGLSNTAVGWEAMLENSSGSNNCAFGYKSLYDNRSGNTNTAIGNHALYTATIANNNVAVGNDAGGNTLSGSNNTFLGYSAEASSNSYSNATAIGYQSSVGGSNEIRLGNSAITEIGGYVTWTVVSDGRYKKNVRENVKGLDFILKLRPVTYNLEINNLAQYLHEDEHRNEDGNLAYKAPDQSTKESRDEKEKIIYSGFIAQEVEQAADASGYDFSGIAKPTSSDDLYGLKYAEFVVPMVKAMQEQQAIIDALVKEVSELKKQMNEMRQ